MNLSTPLAFLLVAAAFTNSAAASVWQWSVPDGNARAYLWIPPECQRVRGVVLCNHNMIEQGILEHPAMRKTLSDLSFAEVWVVPQLDHVFDPAGAAGEHFQRVMDQLADESGYIELKLAPIVPLGHSANATWPWNFAAWNPGRTLAVLSVHGDAPQTNLTGYGGKNPDWGDRNIGGVPGLMVMGEFEWWEDRLKPMFAFRQRHPNAPVALLGDAGHGHFDFSDQLVEFLAMFIRESAEARLPNESVPLNEAPKLRPVDSQRGWLVDRWRRDEKPTAAAAPFAEYTGDRSQAFWAFDKEMADATEAYYARVRGKKPQLLGVVQDSKILPQTPTAEQVRPRFEVQEDGMTFKLDATFLDAVPSGNGNPTKWANLPVGSPLGHAAGGGPIQFSRIVGPVEQIDASTFRLHFGRAEYTQDRRNYDMWLLASHPGDDKYKSAVQQLMIRADANKAGQAQTITFPKIQDVPQDTRTVELTASSDSGLPVQYYIREGPAEIDGDTVKLTPVPPRSKFPVRVTVVAWQWGRSIEPKIQTATPVEIAFFVTKPQ